jgi:hypothetical protein
MRAATKTIGQAALAVVVTSLLAGSVPLAGANVSSGDRAIYVPITPCRLFDTRSALGNIGPRSTPIGPGETFTLQAIGANGNCTIPLGAVGVAMNTTAVNGSASSFLTVFPAGEQRPLAASLNWVAGQSPTPNQLILALGTDGKISLFNLAGTVDVVGDIVGYYEGHDHDDRYYTKAQVDADRTTRSMSFPAEGLLAGGLTRAGSGLSWPESGASEVAVPVHRPRDYVPNTPVTLKLLFATPAVVPPATIVQFHARPRDYNSGDPFQDVNGANSDLVSINSQSYMEATVVFAANALPKEWWYITVQRNTGMVNACNCNIALISVELSYTAFVNPP